VLRFQEILHCRVGKLGLAHPVGVRGCLLPDALALYEDLSFKKKIILAGLALHVIDLLALFHVSIEAENGHKRDVSSALRKLV
jgi:hypothetical protein